MSALHVSFGVPACPGPPSDQGLVWLKLTTLLLLSATVATAGPPSGNAPQVGLLAVKMKMNAAAFAGGQQ